MSVLTFVFSEFSMTFYFLLSINGVLTRVLIENDGEVENDRGTPSKLESEVEDIGYLYL